MNVKEEKDRIIKRIESIDDESILVKMNEMLDSALAEVKSNSPLEESLQRGIEQSKLGKGSSHSEVMARIRKKYNQ